MPKKILFCEECDAEYTIQYKGNDKPSTCPFCGSEIDLGWNSDDDEETTS